MDVSILVLSLARVSLPCKQEAVYFVNDKDTETVSAEGKQRKTCLAFHFLSFTRRIYTTQLIQMS